MNRLKIRSFRVGVVAWHISANGLAGLKCRGCRSSLDIHQPNPNQPDQFLGTCENCGRWFRVELRPDDHQATVMQIPEVIELQSPEPEIVP